MTAADGEPSGKARRRLSPLTDLKSFSNGGICQDASKAPAFRKKAGRMAQIAALHGDPHRERKLRRQEQLQEIGPTW